MFDYSVFTSTTGAHWVVFNCHTGRNVAQGTAETVEAAETEGALEAISRTIAKQLDDLVSETLKAA